jgi:hypothetical protein
MLCFVRTSLPLGKPLPRQYRRMQDRIPARVFLWTPQKVVKVSLILWSVGRTIVRFAAAPITAILSRIAGSLLIGSMLPASALAQNCVISGGVNNGLIVQNCVPVKPILAFDPTIAEELVRRLPSGKPINVMSVGKQRDQLTANQYIEYLQKNGFHIARHDSTIVMIPEPEHPITIYDVGSTVNLEISPSAYSPD